MRTFTDDELESLILCPKQVDEPPRREMRLDGKHKRNDMTLKSMDGKHCFRVFMRQSEEFSENFSVGLVYLPSEEPGSFQLIRCNGQHGASAGIRITLYSISIEAKRTTLTRESWSRDKSTMPLSRRFVRRSRISVV